MSFEAGFPAHLVVSEVAVCAVLDSFDNGICIQGFVKFFISYKSESSIYDSKHPILKPLANENSTIKFTSLLLARLTDK